VPHNNPTYTSELIYRLLRNYKLAKEIGKRGEETARKLFNRDRYREDWLKFLRGQVKIKV
jgi:glycosyltransferase involved in cell wall biosynthesis